MSVRVRAYAAAAALLVMTGSAAAQSTETIELPEIVVTTASPVVKHPKKKRTTATQAPAQAPGETPASALPVPELQPLPNSIAGGEGLFVPVTVTTNREFVANGGATVTDTLQMKPGISGTTFAPGANRPIIRGLDSYRVRTQENGISTHDVAAISEDHAIPVDPLAADRVEVVRGPATLRYGSQAIGGVVSVENERVPTFIPRGGFSGRVVGGLSSVDDGADGAMSITAGQGGFALHADGFRRDSDDYDSPRGAVLNTFVESQGASIGTSLVGTEGFVGVAYTRFESLYGVPGEEAEEGVNPKIDMVQDKVTAKGEWHVHSSGIDAVRFWFGASDYAHDELAIHEPEESSEFEIGSRFTNREQEARVEVQHSPFLTGLGELNGAIGVHVDNRKTRGQSFEGESLLEPAHTQSAAAFWFEELTLSQQLRVQAATRIEETTVDGRGWEEFHGEVHGDHGHFHAHDFEGERSFTPVSGGLGMLYDLPFGTVARLNGQYVERAPDAAELFSKGMHEATGTFEVGNPFLKEEKASTIEAGLKKASGPFRFDASAYYTRYRGFIYRALQGLQCDPVPVDGEFNCVEEGAEHDHEGEGEEHEHEHLFDLVFFQQRDATFYGTELAAQLDMGRVWNGIWGFDAQYDFVRAKFSNGENVPRIPPHRLGGGIYYHDPQWFARAGLLHAFGQDEFGLHEIATPDYTLVSAELSYTTLLTSPDGTGSLVTIGVKGENLADDEVLNHASFKRAENVLLPGANVRLFGSVKLN
jgi:iron complex outermembrane recepter protein